jgi:hypothetical protein
MYYIQTKVLFFNNIDQETERVRYVDVNWITDTFNSKIKAKRARAVFSRCENSSSD